MQARRTGSGGFRDLKVGFCVGHLPSIEAITHVDDSFQSGCCKFMEPWFSRIQRILANMPPLVNEPLLAKLPWTVWHSIRFVVP